MYSVCERCPAQPTCLLNPGGKACLRNAAEKGFDARPTMYDRVREMDMEEMAVFFAKVKAQLYRADLSVSAYTGAEVNEALDWLSQVS